jgi:hypothetical protein
VPSVLGRAVFLAIGLNADDDFGVRRTAVERLFHRLDGLVGGVDERGRGAGHVIALVEPRRVRYWNRDADFIDAVAVELQEREIDVAGVGGLKGVNIGVESADRIVLDRCHRTAAV